MDNITAVQYKISTDNDLLDNVYDLRPFIKEKLAEMHVKVEKKKNSAVKELIDLIQKFPATPQFKNQLSRLYALQGNMTKAMELNHWIVKEHPDYLYGKINLAYEYLRKKQFEKVPEILGAALEIKELYPYRNEFHKEEVLSFYYAAVWYFAEIGDDEQAEMRLEIMEEIDDQSHHTQAAQNRMMSYRLMNFSKRIEKEDAERKTVKAVAAKVAEPTTESPVFNHKIVEQLYCNSMRIPQSLIAEILALPKDTLLQDLHAVVYDSIARFDYFQNTANSSPLANNFFSHALFIISEIAPPDSLPVVLDVLRQDDEYIELWFGDALEEIAGECIFSVGLNQTDKLLQFLKEPDRQTYARSTVASVIAQIALHYPERRNEAIAWFKNIFEFFYNERNNERIIDTDLIGLMISSCLDFHAPELKPVIKLLFEEHLVSTTICGDWREVEQELDELQQDINKPNIHKKERRSIYEKYDYILQHWHYYKSGEDLDDTENTDDDTYKEYDNYGIEDADEIEDIPVYNNVVKEQPLIKSHPKISRNEPCPCGSGKKYKRCCGKN